jgi:hypothetical protein
MPSVFILDFLVIYSSTVLKRRGTSPSPCFKPLLVVVSSVCILTWKADSSIVTLVNHISFLGIPKNNNFV